MTPVQFSCDLPASARSATDARRFVLQALTRWSRDDLADTAALLTSEVVTNSVLHARTPMQVVVSRIDDGIAVEVADGSSHRPQLRRAGEGATNGRGLALVEQLASTWGVTLTNAGKTVRFTLSGTVDPWAAYTGTDWAADL
jgi:anti-sigma regulatory factor (Ser/Thr protein kinase)